MGLHVVPSAVRAAAVALALVAPASAWAEPQGLTLNWLSPDDCQRGPQVLAKVRRLLGGSRAAPLEQALSVVVQVKRESASHYVAELRTETQEGVGSKRLEGESCDALALAVSVVLALSIDPAASLAIADSEEPELKVAQRPPPEAPPPEPSPSSAPPSAPPVAPYAQLSMGVLSELLGEPSVFGSAGAGLRYRRLRLELRAALHQPRKVYRPQRPSVGAELKLYSAELRGCFAAFAARPVGLEVCAGAELEALSAEAFGVTHPDSGSVLLLAGVGALRGRLQATRWLSATLELGASARPFHPTFVLLGVGDVFETPDYAGFAGTGLSLEF